MSTFSWKKAAFFFCLWISNLYLTLSQFPTKNNTSIVAIVDDIRNRRFESAQNQIENMQNNEMMLDAIVHQVYSNSENNTKLILDFAADSPLISRSFLILRALKNEMKANGHWDLFKLISLVRAFEDDVLFQGETFPEIISETLLILKECKAYIKTSAVECLTSAMLSNKFVDNPSVQNVTNALFNFEYNLDDQVMQEMVNQTFSRVPTIQIADSIMIVSTYIPQKITVLLALYEKLESLNDLNSKAVLQIANYFKYLKVQDNYRNLFQPKKYAVNDVIRRMPICAKNLYFGLDLCIWNRGRSEYLYAAMSQHNLSRRGIFTYGPEHITAGGVWNIQFYEEFYFESNIYKKEYMYASTTDKYDAATRHVLTWVDDGFVGDTSAWTIELLGDYCYIKNVNFNEYLYTSEKVLNERKRYVFTAISEPALDNLDFQWQLRNCG